MYEKMGVIRMALMTYMFIGLYALLTGSVGLQQWRGKGFRVRYLLFIIVSLSMLVTMFLQNKGFARTIKKLQSYNKARSGQTDFVRKEHLKWII